MKYQSINQSITFMAVNAQQLTIQQIALLIL